MFNTYGKQGGTVFLAERKGAERIMEKCHFSLEDK
jgi:hypothetical protein